MNTTTSTEALLPQPVAGETPRSLVVAVDCHLKLPLLGIGTPAKVRHLDSQCFVMEVPKFVAHMVAKRMPPRVRVELITADGPGWLAGRLTLRNGEVSIAIERTCSTLALMLARLGVTPRAKRHDLVQRAVNQGVRVNAGS